MKEVSVMAITAFVASVIVGKITKLKSSQGA